MDQWETLKPKEWYDVRSWVFLLPHVSQNWSRSSQQPRNANGNKQKSPNKACSLSQKTKQKIPRQWLLYCRQIPQLLPPTGKGQVRILDSTGPNILAEWCQKRLCREPELLSPLLGISLGQVSVMRSPRFRWKERPNGEPVISTFFWASGEGDKTDVWGGWAHAEGCLIALWFIQQNDRKRMLKASPPAPHLSLGVPGLVWLVPSVSVSWSLSWSFSFNTCWLF